MMNNSSRLKCAALLAAVCGILSLGRAVAQSPTTLADQPIFGSVDVPGNMALPLSVEFPTAISVANLNNYADTTTYYGYFDPAKCYNYLYNAVTPDHSYFEPEAFAAGTNRHSCTGMWSGNYMNWATMQTIDPFRWALTGGYRSYDTTSKTILEKAWGATQGSTSNFPYRGTSQGTSSGHYLNPNLISSLTPFSQWPQLNTGIWGNGNTMLIAAGTGYTASTTNPYVYDLPNYDVLGACDTLNPPQPTYSCAVPNSSSNVVTYRVYIRVSVCDYSTMGLAGLESNCVGYGPQFVNAQGVTQYTTYKPQGLMQQYANKIEYSVFSYLNGYGTNDQGGVLRAPMGFIGPTYPQPLSSSTVTNTRPEWDPNTGIMYDNPDTVSAASTSPAVTQSGAMNYINKFGENAHQYETYDNVSELYYAVVRYYENLKNVPEWLANVNASTLDGFPAVPTWTDPISYYCQKNFILGIGDDHTWVDYNVGGSDELGSNVVASRPTPVKVASDSFNQSWTWLADLQTLEGITPTTPWWIYGEGATSLMAGLAYGIHTVNIRPDLTTAAHVTTPITVATYWMDVAEYQEVENLNPYYLATKYGGFTVPAGYNINSTTNTPLQQSWYDTTGNTITMNGGYVHPLPDNYFEAGNAGTMVASLSAAFSNIASSIQAFTTSFSLSSPSITTSGALSFASSYQSNPWNGTVQAGTLTLSATAGCTSPPCTAPLWSTNTTLQAQLAGTGWQTSRNVATWNGSSGVPFEAASLTSAQLNALQPNYATSVTSAKYLAWLRGDQSNEVGSMTTGSTQSLRARTLLLGDIVDAELLPVSTPLNGFSESTNPGYAAFTTEWTTTNPRPTMVYAAANDGMLHAFLGTAIGTGPTTSAGSELFAYVPSATFQGPNGTPQVNGLAELGNPNYTHYYYVDSTPVAFDVDLNHVNGAANTGPGYTPNWHTILIGGLGKGGKSYYAIDITDPASMTTESAVAGKVLWEFSDSTMGYSYGAPTVVKTVKYGWVVVFTSGYDNGSSYGYLYLVNPANGELLQKIQTPTASTGLTQASAYVPDYTDYTADSVYVGDLNGQVWRFDLTGTGTTYPQPTVIANLTAPNGSAQPITTAPLAEIHPTTRKRYILVGTGQILSANDVSSTQTQTFYGIIDGTAPAGGFKTFTSPASRSNMTAFTSLLTANVVPSSSDGWYYDLPTGLRIITQPTDYNGIVIFSATNPTTTDPCAPQGSSALFAVDYATGLSVLNSGTTTSPTVLTDVLSANLTTNVNVLNQNGNILLLTGDNKGNNTLINANLTEPITTRILNWAELPTAE